MRLRHEDYLQQLQRPAENRLTNRRIGNKLHVIYSQSLDKRGLCAYDDKLFILEDGVNTLAYGHRDITTRLDVVNGALEEIDDVRATEVTQPHFVRCSIGAEPGGEVPPGQFRSVRHDELLEDTNEWQLIEDYEQDDEQVNWDIAWTRD